MNNLPLRRDLGFLPNTTVHVFRVLFFAVLGAIVCAWPVVARATDSTTAKSTDSTSKPADSSLSGKGDPDKTLPGTSIQLSNYVLRPTDVISVRVIDDPKANCDITIGVDGTIRLTYLDPGKPLKVEGLTLKDVVKMIARAYVDQKIFIKPTITIRLKSYTDHGRVIIVPEQNWTLDSAIRQAKAHALDRMLF